MRYALALVTLLFATPSLSAEPLGAAATYAVDKVACRLEVPQAWIEQAIAAAQLQYGITREDAILRSAYAGQALINDLVEVRRVAEWCEARRMK